MKTKLERKHRRRKDFKKCLCLSAPDSSCFNPLCVLSLNEENLLRQDFGEPRGHEFTDGPDSSFFFYLFNSTPCSKETHLHALHAGKPESERVNTTRIIHLGS